MPKKNTPETPRWNQAGDPQNAAAFESNIKRYLTAQPKKNNAAEAARWDQNGDPLNDAAAMADIRRYLLP